VDALSSGHKALILIESTFEIIKTPNAQRWHKEPKDGPLSKRHQEWRFAKAWNQLMSLS